MNTNNQNGRNEAANQINDKEICLLCGRHKQEKNLVCYNCYQGYENALIISVGEGLKEISVLEWTLKKAEELLAPLKDELSKAQDELDKFKERVSNNAYQQVKKALTKAVPKEVFSEILDIRGRKLWQEGNGNKLYGRVKCLELRARKLPSFITELEKKLVERNQEGSSQGSDEAEKE